MPYSGTPMPAALAAGFRVLEGYIWVPEDRADREWHSSF